MIRMADLDKLATRRYHDRDIWKATDVVVDEYFLTGRLSTPNVSGIDLASHTEDAYFFALLDQAGLKSYVDTGLVCSHYDKRTRTFYLPPNDSGIAIKPDAWNREPRVVNLGAGHDTNPYEVNVDLRDDPNIQYKCDIRNLPNDWENQFDMAKAHHVLEHFDFRDVPAVLKEWVRILKPGGVLRIAVPDREAIAKAITEGRMDPESQGNICVDEGPPGPFSTGSPDRTSSPAKPKMASRRPVPIRSSRLIVPSMTLNGIFRPPSACRVQGGKTRTVAAGTP